VPDRVLGFRDVMIIRHMFVEQVEESVLCCRSHYSLNILSPFDVIITKYQMLHTL
jgi:hypothetical protein